MARQTTTPADPPAPRDEHAWPALPWQAWGPTVTSLHLWSQVIGKVRMALTPPMNHWWHVPLVVAGRGVSTGVVPWHAGSFQIDIDLLDHRLVVETSDDRTFTMPLAPAMPLAPTTVAAFHGRLMAGLRDLGIGVSIMTRPVEMTEAVPFETDERHATYEPSHATALFLGLQQAERVMAAFQSGFVGKASPVQLYWGSLDLAQTRFSGRPAPRHPGGAPNCPDWVMEEAYSREQSSVGWWPSSDPPGPAFYAYAYPEPPGYRDARVSPDTAVFDSGLGEFILPYDAARATSDPDATVLGFFRSTYEAAADLGRWDRPALEPAVVPGRPPTRPWSTLEAARPSR